MQQVDVWKYLSISH